MTEPVSLAQLKRHLRLDLSDTSEDDDLTDMIVGARCALELKINRSIVGATLTLELDAFPERAGAGVFPIMPIEAELADVLDIELAGGTVASVTSITYVDEAGVTHTLDPSGYVSDLGQVPARLAPIGAWPKAINRPGAVTIVYVVSPLAADKLALARRGMLLTMGHWYRNREGIAVDVRGIPAELPLSVSWIVEALKKWPSS